MKTKTQWTQDITNLTTKIDQEFPELSKYITEIHVLNTEKEEEVAIKDLAEYYNSLKEIINKYARTHAGVTLENRLKRPVFPDLLSYPPSEDIYQQDQKKMNIDPADPSKNKSLNERDGYFNEKVFNDDMSGDDLDVPGSELDDQQESVGSEDEENNYYSLGGDNHHDLDENNG